MHELIKLTGAIGGNVYLHARLVVMISEHEAKSLDPDFPPADMPSRCTQVILVNGLATAVLESADEVADAIALAMRGF